MNYLRLETGLQPLFAMRTLWQDLRYGMRLLLRSPGFTLVAVLTLAIGIAANTTVFSWIDAVLLRPLSGTGDGDRLVAVELVEPHREGYNISYADFRDYRDNLKLLSGIAVSDLPSAFTLGKGERAQRVWGEAVSGNYFAVLQVKPLLGRFFSRDEWGDELGAHPVAVIGERLWRTTFRADPRAIGKTVRVNRRELTVIGVAPAAFHGIVRGLSFHMWVPITMAPQLGLLSDSQLRNRQSRGLNAIARLSPGATIEQARAEIAALARRLETAYPATNTGISATLLPERETHAGAQTFLRGPLKVLMAMCGLVLLIACVNVANLLLARSIARQKELSVRAALGASRVRLVRQLLTESLLLAGMGALAGATLAAWMQQGLSYLAPVSISLPVSVTSTMRGEVFAFSALVAVVAALLSGISPALHAIRSDMNENLKEGGRSVTASAESHRMRALFVVSEIALSLVALAGAGLFVRSFQNARTIDPGFDTGNVLVAEFHLSAAGYDPAQQQQFCTRLKDRLQQNPAIAEVSYADRIPLGFGLGGASQVEVEGYVPRRPGDTTVGRNAVAPGYFHLLRIPLLEGRDFTARDGRDTEPVLIVNQTFAKRFLAGANPVGRKVHVWGRWLTVIGMVADTKHYTLTEAPRPYFFAPFARGDRREDIAFYVRTNGNPAEALRALRREAAIVDPEGPAFDAMPLADYIAAPLFSNRMAASLLSVLAALSLLLAAVGLYGMMAYAVGQRVNEIGIRMALGAAPRDVLGMVVRQGLVMTAAGLGIGIAVALAAGRLVAGMLVNVNPADPRIFAFATLFLGLVALVASYLPAYRATKVDAVSALRCQ
jgi:predicted permease